LELIKCYIQIQLALQFIFFFYNNLI